MLTRHLPRAFLVQLSDPLLDEENMQAQNFSVVCDELEEENEEEKKEGATE